MPVYVNVSEQTVEIADFHGTIELPRAGLGGLYAVLRMPSDKPDSWEREVAGTRVRVEDVHKVLFITAGEGKGFDCTYYKLSEALSKAEESPGKRVKVERAH